MKALTTELFIERARKVHGDKYDYSKVEYKNCREKVCIICPEHGEFLTLPEDHLGGHGCFKCRKCRKKLTTEDFVKRAKEIHGDKYDYSIVDYKTSRDEVCIICQKHGKFWIKPYRHLQGQGCKKCGYEKVREKTFSGKDRFVKKAKEIHGNRYDYSKVEYINNKTKVCIICPEHGEFWMKPNAHLNGQCCPECKFSRLEKEMCSFLDSHNIIYEKQKRFDWLKRQSLDFYIPKYKMAIECQGEQHFKPVEKYGGFKQFIRQIEMDEKKFNLCKENNIDLIYFAKCKTVPNYMNKIFRDKQDIIEYLSSLS